MRLQGLSDSEIVESMTATPAVDVASEQAELDAIVSVRERNADRCRDGCVIRKAVVEFNRGVGG